MSITLSSTLSGIFSNSVFSVLTVQCLYFLVLQSCSQNYWKVQKLNYRPVQTAWASENIPNETIIDGMYTTVTSQECFVPR